MKSKLRFYFEELFRICQVAVNGKHEPDEEHYFCKAVAPVVRRIECEMSGRPDLLNLDKGGEKK